MSLKNLAILGLLLILACISTCEVYFSKGSPHVKLANGVVSGNLVNSRDGRPFSSFIGLPYAKVPERFAESVPITEPWEGVQSAMAPGPMCAQHQWDAEGGTFGEENCLNLNVYVPMNNTGKRGYPVMVWIHGGAYAFGGGLGYGPKFYMDEDVILITINYRLGVYGFLSTGDHVVPGNNGLKDQVMALKWVQENVKQFGGDSSRVTIFGESAGGTSVHYLMLSPMAKGLFHRAISQSGTAVGLWAYEPNPKEQAVKLAKHLKCETTSTDETFSSEEILTCLRSKTTEELSRAQWDFVKSFPQNLHSFVFVPTAEPEATATSTHTPFITQSPWTLLQDKNQPLVEIPWMVGVTEDEGAGMFAGVILKEPELTTELDTKWNEILPEALDYDRYLSPEERDVVSQKIREFYFASKQVSRETRENLTNLYSDVMFLHPVYTSAVETASRGKRNTVYLYQYAYHGPVSIMGMTLKLKDESLAKVGHGDELILQFDFNKPGSDGYVQPDTPHEDFSKNFVKLWTSFASQGEPKHSWGTATYRKWKAISKKELDGVYPMRWFRIDENPAFIDNPYKDRIQFWDTLWRDHFGPYLQSTAAPAVEKEPVAKTEL